MIYVEEWLAKARDEANIEIPPGAEFAMRGVQDELVVYKDYLTIKPVGVLGFLNKGIKGTKEIPFSSITAVQFKEAGAAFSGYLQFTILGGNESRGGILAGVSDENTFMFGNKTYNNNDKAVEIKGFIASAVKALKSPTPATNQPSVMDEIKKLAELKEAGVLSDSEFADAKKKLMEKL